MKRKKILHCVACPGKKLIKDTKTTYTIKCPLGVHKGAKNPVKTNNIFSRSYGKHKSFAAIELQYQFM